MPSHLTPALCTPIMPEGCSLLAPRPPTLLILRSVLEPVNGLLECNSLLLLINVASLFPIHKATAYFSPKQEILIWNSWNLP